MRQQLFTWLGWLPYGVVRMVLTRQAGRMHVSFRGNTRRVLLSEIVTHAGA